MSSDPFDLLELDRATATDADVRRAYAAKLKVTRPEDDRAGFMALRAAFERARNEVRWRGIEDDDPYGDDDDADAQDHSPPDAYGQSSAETGRPPVTRMDAPPAEMPAEAGPPEDEPDFEDYGEAPEPLTPAEMDYDRRVNGAYERLIELLTRDAGGAAARDVLKTMDHGDVAGIEEYQTMQWKVRDFLCDRTGFNLEPQHVRVPDWLTLEIFDTLDGYYGWSRQPGTRSYVRQLNDWLVRVRKEMALQAMPPEARRKSALEDAKADLFGSKDAGQQGGGRSGGGGIWLWIGAGILISQLLRFFMTAGGG